MRGLMAAILVVIGMSSNGAALAQGTAEAPYPGCRNNVVTIADLQWPSASILAHIHRELIRAEYICNAQVVQSDLANVAATMDAAQEPRIVPEFWITRVAAQWNDISEAQRAFMAAQTFDVSTLEGWYVPTKVVTDFPQLSEAQKLPEMAKLYQRDKVRFINCPEKWACNIINQNLIRAFGMQNRFEIVVPDSRFEMDQLIGQIISAREPAVFYYWQPNAILHQFDFAALSLGEYAADAYPCLAQPNCAAPQPSAFPDEKVGLVAASNVRADMPELIGYLQRATMPVALMNELLAYQERQRLSPEQTAVHFVSTYPQVWAEWVQAR